LTEVGCWSHARRKIYEVYETTAAPLAKEALDRIAELFEIEARINGRVRSERLAVRQQEADPLLAELEAFFDRAQNQISGKSTLAQAIRYSLSRWPALTRYTTDGRLDMTNNAVGQGHSDRPSQTCPQRISNRSRAQASPGSASCR
jgi:transposase